MLFYNILRYRDGNLIPSNTVAESSVHTRDAAIFA
jgi:hypothetical protein